MEFTPSPVKDDAAQARTLASQAQDLLRRDILSGSLAPGQRLRTKDLQVRVCGLDGIFAAA